MVNGAGDHRDALAGAVFAIDDLRFTIYARIVFRSPARYRARLSFIAA
jgi:hypothetical protein